MANTSTHPGAKSKKTVIRPEKRVNTRKGILERTRNGYLIVLDCRKQAEDCFPTYAHTVSIHTKA